MADDFASDRLPSGHWQPPPEARERILRNCRREMAARFRAERRRRRRAYWSLAFAVALLLALNAVEERRIAMRLDRITQSGLIQSSLTASDVAGSARARARLLTSLLRDPNAL